MVKKILMWTGYAALVGLLVFGGVIRTSAKTDQNISQVDGQTEEGVFAQPRGGQGNGQREINTGQSQTSADQEDSGLGEDEDHLGVSLSGVIQFFSTDEMQMGTGSGEIVQIADRAWRFALELGFDPHIGDQIVLQGFFENGEFETMEIKNLSTGQTVVLRDESGRPLWAGSSAL